MSDDQPTPPEVTEALKRGARALWERERSQAWDVAPIGQRRPYLEEVMFAARAMGFAALVAELDDLRGRFEILNRLRLKELDHHGYRVSGWEEQIKALEAVVEAAQDLRQWAERHHGGDSSLDPEEYYIARDSFDAALARLAERATG